MEGKLSIAHSWEFLGTPEGPGINHLQFPLHHFHRYI